MVKIGFLFGAGAEGKHNFDLPSGDEYFRRSLLEDYGDSFKRIIQNMLDPKTKGTMETFPDSDPYFSMIRILSLGKETNDLSFKERFPRLTSLFRENRRESKEVQRILEEVKSGVTTKYKSTFLKSLIDDPSAFNVAGVLIDEVEHSLANGALFSRDDNKKLCAYYWKCFVILMEAIAKNLGDPSLQFDESMIEDYERLSKFVREIYRANIEDFSGFSDSYYRHIKDQLAKRPNFDCVVSTTNYFRFAECLSKHVDYINGKMCLLEDIRSLNVIDITKEKPKKGLPYVPFILGQSYVKPLICPEQSEAYMGFASHFRSSRYYVILGYGLNDCDQHVNAVLRRCKKKKMIVVVEDEQHTKRVKRVLQVKRKRKNLRFVYFKDKDNRSVVDEVFKIIDSWEGERT